MEMSALQVVSGGKVERFDSVRDVTSARYEDVHVLC